MEKPINRNGWVRISLALLIAVLFLGNTIPSTGRVVIDRSTARPIARIEDRPKDIAVLLGMLVVPLACIYFGTRRSRALEITGWVLLLALFIGVPLMHAANHAQVDESLEKR